MHNNNAARHSIVSIAVAGAAAALLIIADARAEIESNPGLSSAGAEQLSREEALAGAMREYHQAFESELYDEAATSMHSYVRMLLQDEQYDRRVWASALVNLGNAQRQLARYAAAIENYELAISTLAMETNRLDESLIDPYLAAGAALADNGQYDEATKMLEFAVHLQQVNGGLFNMAQTAPLTQLSAFYLKTGDLPRAVASQTSYLNVVDQNYPGDDMRKTPAMLAHARVLAEAGHLIDSHSVYRRTISMIERVEGRQSPNLLPAFYEIVDFITNNNINDGFDGLSRARRILQRAVYVAENSEAATPIHRADAYIEMGDYLTENTMNRDGALRNYQKAWQLLAGDALLAMELQQRFGQASLLNAEPRTTAPDMRNRLEEVERHGGDPNALITVGFDVDTEGFPQNVEILEGTEDPYWSKLAVEHVNRFIFRPKLEDGEASTTEGLRWSFNYRANGGEIAD